MSITSAINKLAITVVLIISSCGGGGGGTSTAATAPYNQPSFNSTQSAQYSQPAHQITGIGDSTMAHISDVLKASERLGLRYES